MNTTICEACGARYTPDHSHCPPIMPREQCACQYYCNDCIAEKAEALDCGDIREYTS